MRCFSLCRSSTILNVCLCEWPLCLCISTAPTHEPDSNSIFGRHLPNLPIHAVGGILLGKDDVKDPRKTLGLWLCWSRLLLAVPNTRWVLMGTKEHIFALLKDVNEPTALQAWGLHDRVLRLRDFGRIYWSYWWSRDCWLCVILFEILSLGLRFVRAPGLLTKK